MALAIIAILIERLAAMNPIAGPPLIWPIASTWPFTEKNVARVEESGMILFSQVSSSGAMTDRVHWMIR